MATAAALFSQLRRVRPSSSLSLLYMPRVLISHRPPPLPASVTPHSPTLGFLDAFRSRAFWTRSSDAHESELDSFGVDSGVNSELQKVIADSGGGVDSGVNSELLKVIADSGGGVDSGVNSELLKVIADSGGGGEDDALFPVRAVISMLDSFHDISGFPWWITIAFSTLALRIVLLCPLILTLHKLKRIGEFFPKLPPPFPPPFSGKSYIRQFKFFVKERKAVGCPSYVWPLVPIIVQGGALWFQNLTELSHGYTGFIFPFLIAGLHYINVQISFHKPVVEETRDIFDLLAKYYKRYLDFLTVPIALTCFCIPQGSLLYWVTNSSLTLIQHIALRHPAVLAKLGLGADNRQQAASKEIGASKTTPALELPENSPTAATGNTVSLEKSCPDSPENWHRLPIEDMSPKELTTLSVPFLSSNDKDSAIPLLKLALDKDPEYIRALVLMGRVLLLKRINDEANEYFERAISKLLLAGHPTDAEDVDLLILSSQWAGVACERQGKRAEGQVHFERIANMEEPEDPTSKGYYFDTLLLLASALFDAGQKAEAAKYLRLVVAYNPAYKKFLDQCELDDDITSDLANSRREL